MEPLVSVILPVCNADDYLPDCLDSLLNQKHQNLEIIAVDDKSKDKSVSILRKYRKIDKRLKVTTNVKRYGLAVTLNRALRKAHGDFITFMNPHDKNSMWRIKKQLDYLKNNPNVVAVGTQAINIDEKGKIIQKTDLPHSHENIYQNFIRGLSMQLESIMINKKRIPRDLLYFQQNKYPFVYIEAFVKLFKYGQFANLMQHLYYHRGKPVTASKLSATGRFTKIISLFVKSVASYDYRPSLRALLPPFARINVG